MTDFQKDIAKLEKMADWMDSRFTIPGTNIKFGLDALFGLIPASGDTGTLATTFYIISKAQTYDVPWYIQAKMLWNAFIDWLIGLIPVIGDIFDIGFKSNRKNVELLKKHANP